MNKEILFAQTLEQVRKTAREQGNCISEEQVKDAFAELDLSGEQLQMVFDYLLKHKIGIGQPMDPDEFLTDEEKDYLQEYLDEVAELERICFTTPWSRNMLAEELDNYLSAFLVALDDNGKVAGYAGLQAVLDEGYITNVAVRPDCRKQGVASKLLQVFLDFAQANHLAFLTLEVRASNYPAIALYGSRGFRGVGRRKNYYEHPREDAIIMTREFEQHGTENPVS